MNQENCVRCAKEMAYEGGSMSNGTFFKCEQCRISTNIDEYGDTHHNCSSCQKNFLDEANFICPCTKTEILSASSK